jgi:hypothetical protein
MHSTTPLLGDQDLDGDTFQVNPTSTVMDLLETYRPEWRTKQSDFMCTIYNSSC